MTSSLPEPEPSVDAWVLVVPEAIEDEASGLVWTRGCTGITIEKAPDGKVRLVCFFTNPGAHAEEIQKLARGFETTAERIQVPNPDWVQRFKETFVAFDAPPFRIVPDWATEADGNSEASIIRVDPGRAFGTGTHESTKLCLQTLGAIAKTLKSSPRTLDLGCGTGILGIAAVKLMNARVLACDYDPLATASASKHARMNDVALEVLHMDGCRSLRAGQFDLVFANLMAPFLISRVSEITAMGAPRLPVHPGGAPARRRGRGEIGLASGLEGLVVVPGRLGQSPLRAAVTIHRFHVPAVAPGRMELPEAARIHATRVIRLNVGDALRVFDDGREFAAAIAVIEKHRVLIDVGAAVPALPERAVPIHLIMSALKGDLTELVIQKATELGVARISPAVFERTDTVARREPNEARVERWHRVAGGAAEQSGRAVVPRIDAVMTLKDALNSLGAPSAGELRVVATEPSLDSSAETRKVPGSVESVVVAVGPAGGLSGGDLELLGGAGFIREGFALHTLRAETACIAAIAILGDRFR